MMLLVPAKLTRRRTVLVGTRMRIRATILSRTASSHKLANQITKDLVLISNESSFDRYGVRRVW